MTENEVMQVANMLGICAGLLNFTLCAILGVLLAKDLNWYKW